MKILIIGEERRTKELVNKISDEHQVTLHQRLENVQGELSEFKNIFHLNLDEQPQDLEILKSLKATVIGCAVKKSLAQMVIEHNENMKCTLAGMNALPDFIDRDKAEISLYNQNDEKEVKKVFEELNWEFLKVKDRVGMVTPSIIFMIINEACYTVQEGTADMKDIDAGMKLGTNYPFGPFEWGDRIGLKHIYETLEAIYQDTHDERYKICPMLKRKYLKNESFYAATR